MVVYMFKFLFYGVIAHYCSSLNLQFGIAGKMTVRRT